MRTCTGCQQIINDNEFLRVTPNLEWHIKCLKCHCCGLMLEHSSSGSCFIKEGQPYCGEDYYRLFSVRCGGCGEELRQSNLVMKTEKKLYHVNCFTCQQCHVVLKMGDKFRMTDTGMVCYQHGIHKNEKNESKARIKDKRQTVCLPKSCTIIGNTSEHYDKNISAEHTKSARARTVLNEKQLVILKTCYSVNPRPDAMVKRRIVQITGLSPRVIRVWFQNKRCKDKKKFAVSKRQNLAELCLTDSYTKNVDHDTEKNVTSKCDIPSQDVTESWTDNANQKHGNNICPNYGDSFPPHTWYKQYTEVFTCSTCLKIFHKAR